MPIPPTAWKVLRFKDFKGSIVLEPRPTKTAVYEVRIVPALYADDVVSRLDGRPLVEVFDRFVFNDAQVARLRKLTIARGPGIELEPLLRQAYWYLEPGIAPSPGSMGANIVKSGWGNALAADTALRDRFTRVIQLLRDGTLMAEGVPTGGVVPVEVPRALWARKSAVLDLHKGDYFDYQPDPQLPEEHDSLGYRQLRLRRAAVRLPEMLHVKPTEHDGLLGSTITAFPSAKQAALAESKAIRKVKSRADARRECSRWLEEAMKKSPSHKPFPKPQWHRKAEARWGKLLSHRAFHDAWDEAVTRSGAAAWAAAGAPKRPKR